MEVTPCCEVCGTELQSLGPISGLFCPSCEPELTEGPAEPLKVIPMSIDQLIEQREREQQDAYDARVTHARGLGDVLQVYQETVLFGHAYAWVQYKGDRLRLLTLTEEGVTRPG